MQIDKLIEILQAHAEPLSITKLKNSLDDQVSERTLRRWLKKLTDDGSVIASGQYKSRRYQLIDNLKLPKKESVEHPLFSQNSLGIIQRIQRPIFQRDPCTYNDSWLEAYKPNKDFYLTESQRKILSENSLLLPEEQSADTYTKKLFNQLLIDLSYNSSRLEGNTYSLLETQKLLLEGKTASDKLDVENVMILNHKEAIKFLVESINRIAVDINTIRTMHYLLADGLVMTDDAGQIRDESVRISLSTYIPIEGKERLAKLLEKITCKAANIIDPFEQSFFLLVHISYLQAFIDINKRTARLSANIPLVKNNLTPLSFNDIDKDDYISTVIAIYEHNETAPLAELYVWSYLRSCKQYQTLSEAIGIDVFHVRYRRLRRELITKIIQEKIHDKEIQNTVLEFAKNNISKEDCGKFIENVFKELENLESFKIAGMGISQKEFEAWKKQQ